MIPAYSLNRGYSIFFVAFSVIGKQWLLLAVSVRSSFKWLEVIVDYCVTVKAK